tara:strand:+ start:44 stop:502 length:459 start_codon:yes stop_codon:yes gene_type:complete
MLGEEFKAEYLAAYKKERQAAYAKKYREANREKMLASSKKYRDANKEKISASNAKYILDVGAPRNKALRDERNLMLFNYKGAACQDCGISDPTRMEIYDYHHVDPSTKQFQISHIIRGDLDKLMIEVDKCVLLCSNCHRSEHARLREVARHE